MKKRVLALMMCVLMLLSLTPFALAETEDRGTRYLEINETNFPDAVLREWIIEHLDVSGDEQSGYYMTQWQTQGVLVVSLQGTTADVAENELSLQGLELFTGLEELYIEHYTLKPYRFSRIGSLKKAVFEEVNLPNADFSDCPALESLDWTNGNDMALPWFYGYDMAIEKVDFSNCPKLETVEIYANYGNNTMRVDVKNCRRLETLVLGRSSSVGGYADHITDCTALKHLSCIGSGAYSLAGLSNLEVVVIDGEMTSLDLSGCTALKGLAVGGYAFGYSDADALEPNPQSRFQHSEATLHLDLSEAASLENLVLSSYVIKSIDLSGCENLKKLTCSTGTPITELDLSECRNLEILDYSNMLMWDGYTAIPPKHLKTLRLPENGALKSVSVGSELIQTVDIPANEALTYLNLAGNQIRSLDLSNCPALTELDVSRNPLETLDLGNCHALKELTASNCGLTEMTQLGLPADAETSLDVSHNRLETLDLSGYPSLTTVNASYNELTEVRLPANSALTYLNVSYNHLGYLDVSENPDLEDIRGEGQKIYSENGPEQESEGSDYQFDLKAFTGANPAELYNVCTEYYYWEGLDEVKGDGWERGRSSLTYDTTTGLVSRAAPFCNIAYQRGPLGITLWLPYAGEIATVWAEYLGGTYNEYGDTISYKGNTPYMTYQGERAHEPAYVVVAVDESESKYIYLDRLTYDVAFENNEAPGTATMTVTVKDNGNTASNWFKIYLPPTEKTDIANVQDGITLNWDPVDGAKGYVIYRRAWSATTDGWTEFKRWNNTTDTTWTDTKVYAGTRYQYGVKAYFSDPMDNYNLGEVGPLKTTVRITTRNLLGVDAGSKQFTARWDGSKTVTGYQIKYATDAGFTQNVGAVKVTRPDAYRTTVKSLKSGTTYYVTVRGYQVFNGMTYFGEWSNVISCKVR